LSDNSVNNAALVSFEQELGVNGTASERPTIQSIVVPYLITQGYYVPQSGDTWSDIATLAGGNGVTISGTTLQNINAAFSDSSLTAGGLVHVPVASTSVSSGMSLPFLPQGKTYVFDATSGTTPSVYTVGASLDGSNSGALILDTAISGVTGYPTFDQGTYSGISYNSSTHTIGVTLVALSDDTLGTFYIDTATGGISFTAADGAIITPSGISNLHITLPSLAGLSPLQVLAGDFTEAGYTTTTSVLDGDNTASLYSSGLPAQGSTLNLSSHSGVVNQTEFNAFTSISGSGTITAATSSTFDLATAPIAGGSTIGLTATDWLNTTLIGNGQNSQTLTASLLGNDTLYAGNGTGDTLNAGSGVDKLFGGSGGDSFVATGGDGGAISGPEALAAGSVVQGTGTGNSLTVNGDITGVTISSIQTLITGATINGVSGAILTDNITLTNAQWNGFSALELATPVYAPSFTVDAATGGTYDLGAKDSTATDLINMTAQSNAGTTLIDENDEGTLTASATGTDTLTGDSGSYTLIAGRGSDALTVGDGNENTLLGGGGTVRSQRAAARMIRSRRAAATARWWRATETATFSPRAAARIRSRRETAMKTSCTAAAEPRRSRRAAAITTRSPRAAARIRCTRAAEPRIR
jgi:hypothetical protein